MKPDTALLYAEILLRQNPDPVFEVEADGVEHPGLIQAFASLGYVARLVQFKNRIEILRV